MGNSQKHAGWKSHHLAILVAISMGMVGNVVVTGQAKLLREESADQTAPAAAAAKDLPSDKKTVEPASESKSLGLTPRVAAPAAAPVTGNSRAVTDKWAFIVGIGKFEQKTIPQLRFAAKDAQDFRDFLVEKANFAPDHVRLLLDEKATRKQILSGFDKFLGRVARKDDLVVVYFSTHGSPESSDVRGKSYLVSYDADKEDLFASSIPMSDITDLIKGRISSNRVLLVMDTCFSGASAGGGSKSVDEVGNLDAAKLAQGSGQLVICSSSPNEKSWESRRYQNGIFTRKLIESMKIKGSQTRLHEAFSNIAEEVENEVREDHGIRQRPVLATASWKGEDLMLAVPPSAPRQIPDAVKELLEPDSTVAATTPDPSPTRPTESTSTKSTESAWPVVPRQVEKTEKKAEPAANKPVTHTEKPKPVKAEVRRVTPTHTEKPAEENKPAPHKPPAAPLWNRD